MTSLPYLVGSTCIRCGRPVQQDMEYHTAAVPPSSQPNTNCECSEETLYFDRAMSVFEFSGIIQAALYKLKYDGERETASSLGILMARKLSLTKWNIDIIVPVPLHNDRHSERGFNQSYLLAEIIGRERSIDVSDKILLRGKYTKSQTTLSKFERIHNVRGAFEINDNIVVNGRSILLIDDIMTTGATLNECSRILKENGAKQVYCLTAACPYKLK
jgi:competence protein ComFC